MKHLVLVFVLIYVVVNLATAANLNDMSEDELANALQNMDDDTLLDVLQKMDDSSSLDQLKDNNDGVVNDSPETPAVEISKRSVYGSRKRKYGRGRGRYNRYRQAARVGGPIIGDIFGQYLNYKLQRDALRNPYGN